MPIVGIVTKSPKVFNDKTIIFYDTKQKRTVTTDAKSDPRHSLLILKKSQKLANPHLPAIPFEWLPYDI